MSNFRKYEEYTLTLLEGLTFLREEKNSLGTKIDQKKISNIWLNRNITWKVSQKKILGKIEVEKKLKDDSNNETSL